MTRAWALATAIGLEEANRHLAALEDAGLLGLVEEDGRVTAYFAAHSAHPPRGLPLEGRWELVPERDWNAEWKAGIEPVTVGRVTIAPPWAQSPGAIVIEPAQAFGTGHHETTTSCLAALQEHPLAGCAVLDVGTGTGILALAAKRLGAASVLAVDTDPVAVRTARANARANGLEIEVRAGSVPAERAAYDLVVANLDTTTLVALADRLAAALAERGRLVASGVSNERAAQARAALEGTGLSTTVRHGHEWALLVAARRAPSGR